MGPAAPAVEACAAARNYYRRRQRAPTGEGAGAARSVAMVAEPRHWLGPPGPKVVPGKSYGAEGAGAARSVVAIVAEPITRVPS
jgi:hypothetical protein